MSSRFHLRPAAAPSTIARHVRVASALPGRWRRRPFRGAALGATLTLALSALAPSAAAEGTWTAAPINPGVGQAFGLWLLTDGTILSHGSGGLNHWVILTPDKTGSYANGTWKTVATSAFARGGATEHVLNDGRFLEAGGEYIYQWPAHDGVAACTPTNATPCTQPPDGSPLYMNVEIYDPVANTWTVEADGLYDIGDTGSATLSDGRLLYSTRAGNETQIYTPSTNTWTAGPKSVLSSGDENAWASLQNGGVLAVGYATDGAAIYNPATNTWARTGAVPSGFNTGDTAGISLMFDGRVIAYGIGQTYIYTPGATAANPGTWALGPAMYNGDQAQDEYSDTLPNGQVWAGVVTVLYGPGVALQDFDPTTNTVSSVTPPPDKGNPYPIDYVNLPNGQVMVTASDQDWIYTPDTLPNDAWRPTVTSVTFNSGTTYTLTGTQISGLINGADEGDDMTMAENYPIVWLTDTANNVYYCRSFNFSNMMPSNGSAAETTQFTTPAGLAAGTYNLFVSAVGVQSKVAFSFTTGASGAPDSGAEAATMATDAGIASDAMAATEAGTAAEAGAGSGEGGAASEAGIAAEAGGGPAEAGVNDGGGNAVDSGAPSGCGCRTTGDSRAGGSAALLGLFGLVTAARRRRRCVD
jgi:MYXO-CTERM domain-containing protein